MLERKRYGDADQHQRWEACYTTLSHKFSPQHEFAWIDAVCAAAQNKLGLERGGGDGGGGSERCVQTLNPKSGLKP